MLTLAEFLFIPRFEGRRNQGCPPKLSDAQVREIRSLIPPARGKCEWAEIMSKMYGITESHFRKIRRRK